MIAGSEIATFNVPRVVAAISSSTPALFVPNAKAAQRFFEFFTANIRNKNTRRAYYKAVCRFADWCEGRGLRDLANVRPLHVATYIEALGGELAKPTVKQHLAALRMLFDWLVIGQVIDVNPAHAVRGPKYRVKKGKTPILTRDEARALLDSIPVTKTQKREDGTEEQVPCITGLRDRALIGIMIYTFARIGAVLQMNVKDYFTQGRRGRVRLHEKGGKEHEAQCHHNLEIYLDQYIAAAGIAADKDGPLFRTTGRLTGTPQRMTQPDGFRMIQRRARAAGIKTQIGNHSMRATGITAYLKNGGTREHAQAMAAHSSPRTTELYDRRDEEVSLDEYEKVGI
jgi:site-specific recombinase XerD